MNSLIGSVERSIASAVGKPVKIVSTRSVSGGCINNAMLLVTADHGTFFCKSNSAADSAGMLETEAAGLAEIRKTASIGVPEVIAQGMSQAGENFLVLESIDRGQTSKKFFEVFGQKLASMHRLGTAEEFGFHEDNFIGATSQKNNPISDWADFWIENRLGFQLKLARRNGFHDLAKFEMKSLANIGRRLEEHEVVPSLIHGDLWSGNFLVSQIDEPVLIDPAVYYADREAEFGMTTLFGGFDQSFYDAYHESFPLAEGWEERVEIYRLYHQLNHLNLFGASYLSGCLSVLKKFD